MSTATQASAGSGLRIPGFAQLQRLVLSAVTLAAQRIAKAAVAEFGADGVNLLNCCGADAWQTVFHFHMHVIPRYADGSKDRLTLPWSPEPGDKDAIAARGERLSAALD